MPGEIPPALLNNRVKLSLNNSFDIGTVICPRAVVLALGLRPRANTTALEKLTVPISNLLFNNI